MKIDQSKSRIRCNLILVASLLFVLLSIDGISQELINGNEGHYEYRAFIHWNENEDSCLVYCSKMISEINKQTELSQSQKEVWIAFAQLYKNEYDSALLSITKAKPSSLNNSYYKGLQLLATGQCKTYNADTEKGIIDLENAKNIFKTNNYNAAYARTCIVLSWSYFDVGDYEKAILNLNEALPFYLENSCPELASWCYNGIGRILIEQNKIDTAIEFYRKSLKISEQVSYFSQSSSNYNNIGMAFQLVENHDSAIIYFNKAIEIDLEHNLESQLPVRYNNIANSLLKKNKSDEAIEYFEKALNVLEEYPDPAAKGQIINNLGDVYFIRGDYSMAEKLFLESLLLADTYQFTVLQLYNCESLKKLYSKTGQLQDALEYCDRFNILKDSLNNERQIQSINELDIKYKTDKQKDEIKKLSQLNEINNLRLSKQRNILILYLLVLIIVAGFSVFLIYRYRINKRISNLLKKQNTELNETSDLKDRFFNLISHEFRTPLSLIISPALDIKSDPSSTELQIKKSTQIEIQSKRLLFLVNELLDLAKSGKGMLKLKIKPANPESFMSVLCSQFEEAAAKKNINFSFTSNCKNNNVFFDHEKTEKILANLLGNAVKYTQAFGEIKVKAEFTDTTKNLGNNDLDGWLKITVSDNGPGIPPEMQEKIFERFIQLSAENQDYISGTGIGLSIVKEFAELQNGHVELESTVGKGSSFSVFLPAGDKWFSHELLSSEPEKIGDYSFLFRDEISHNKLANNQNLSQSVLIVEDNNDLRNYLETHFSQFYNVYTATNGEEGEKTAIIAAPDIIISDVGMPVKNGFSMCADLKTNIETSHIPIILLTAKADEKSIISGLENGADDYILKPFDNKELELRVRNILLRSQTLREKYQKDDIFPTESLTSLDKIFTQTLIAICETNYSNPGFEIEMFTDELNLSVSTLYRKIKAICGVTPREFLKDFRLKKAYVMIKSDCGNISQVAYDTGFENLSYFTKIFKEKFGILPSETNSK